MLCAVLSFRICLFFSSLSLYTCRYYWYSFIYLSVVQGQYVVGFVYFSLKLICICLFSVPFSVPHEKMKCVSKAGRGMMCKGGRGYDGASFPGPIVTFYFVYDFSNYSCYIRFFLVLIFGFVGMRCGDGHVFTHMQYVLDVFSIHGYKHIELSVAYWKKKKELYFFSLCLSNLFSYFLGCVVFAVVASISWCIAVACDSLCCLFRSRLWLPLDVCVYALVESALFFSLSLMCLCFVSCFSTVSHCRYSLEKRIHNSIQRALFLSFIIVGNFVMYILQVIIFFCFIFWCVYVYAVMPMSLWSISDRSAVEGVTFFSRRCYFACGNVAGASAAAELIEYFLFNCFE